MLAFAVAALAIALGTVRRLPATRPARSPAPLAPAPTPPTPVGFDIDATAGTFQAAGRAPREQPQTGGRRTVGLGQVADASNPGRAARPRRRSHQLRRHRRHRRPGPSAAISAMCPQGLGLMPGRTVWQQVIFGAEADACPSRLVARHAASGGPDSTATRSSSQAGNASA